MNEPENINSTREELIELRDQIQDTIKGRESLVEQAILALASQEHIMIRGKHGEAKSLLAEKVSEATSLNSFIQQIHRETRTKHIAGMLDLGTYEDEGELDIIETEFFNAHLLHFDEFLRGTEEFQDLLLEVMEERRFTKSHKSDVDLPVLSVVATTNPLSQDYNTGRIDDALKSRFAFVADVDHLVEDSPGSDVKSAISMTEEDLEVGSVDITPDDLREFREWAIENVEYNADMIAELAANLEDEGFAVDTRFLRRMRQVCQVAHLVEGYHTLQEELFAQVALRMLDDRWDRLEHSTINTAVDDAVLTSRFSDDLEDIREIRDKEGVTLVENGAAKIQELDDSRQKFPQTLRDRISALEDEIESAAMSNITSLEPGTVQKLGTERFATVRKQYVSNKTARSQMVQRDSNDHGTVKDIMENYAKSCDVSEGDTQGKYISMSATPDIEEPKSFEEAENVQEKLAENDLQHIA